MLGHRAHEQTSLPQIWWFGSWTPHEQHHELQRPTETPFLAIFASRSSWILRVVLNLWFRKVKVKRRLTLQVTRNWPKMRLDRESKVSRWPEHVDQLSPEFRDTVQTTDISTSLLMERHFVSRNIISIFFNTCSWSQYIMAVRSISITIIKPGHSFYYCSWTFVIFAHDSFGDYRTLDNRVQRFPPSYKSLISGVSERLMSQSKFSGVNESKLFSKPETTVFSIGIYYLW